MYGIGATSKAPTIIRVNPIRLEWTRKVLQDSSLLLNTLTSQWLLYVRTTTWDFQFRRESRKRSPISGSQTLAQIDIGVEPAHSQSK